MTAQTELTSLVVLLVCRNRRETTLRAIRKIASQQTEFDTLIYLFDDASTDGTPEAVKTEFPEVRIVAGDGNAFWNGGLYRVWSAARHEEAGAFLWLNDDVDLDEDAFARLKEAYREMGLRQGAQPFILTAATRGTEGEVSYGGKRRAPRRLSWYLADVPPGNEMQQIDTFNGNIVLVPRQVVERIGLNDPAFHHNFGDLDYGLRATAAGVQVMLLPGTMGFCEGNIAKSRNGYGAPGLSLAEQWRKVNTHHGLPVKSWWRMVRRHSGPWWPIHFVTPYRWLFIPRWLRKGAN